MHQHRRRQMTDDFRAVDPAAVTMQIGQRQHRRCVVVAADLEFTHRAENQCQRMDGISHQSARKAVAIGPLAMFPDDAQHLGREAAALPQYRCAERRIVVKHGVAGRVRFLIDQPRWQATETENMRCRRLGKHAQLRSLQSHALANQRSQAHRITGLQHVAPAGMSGGGGCHQCQRRRAVVQHRHQIIDEPVDHAGTVRIAGTQSRQQGLRAFQRDLFTDAGSLQRYTLRLDPGCLGLLRCCLGLGVGLWFGFGISLGLGRPAQVDEHAGQLRFPDDGDFMVGGNLETAAHEGMIEPAMVDPDVHSDLQLVGFDRFPVVCFRNHFPVDSTSGHACKSLNRLGFSGVYRGAARAIAI